MMASLNRGDAVAASAAGAPPALFTTLSSRPKRPTANATTAAACSGSRTSAAVNSALRPAAATGSSGSLRAVMTTSAPASRNRAAIPRPMPLLPPVTRVTVPVRSSWAAGGEVIGRGWSGEGRDSHGVVGSPTLPHRS